MQEQQTTSKPFNPRELIEAGRKETELQYIQVDGTDIPVSLVPKGYELTTHENLLKKFGVVPAQLKQRVELNNAESFVKYLKRHHTPSTAIFCDVDNHKFVAVLDYHEKDEPRWNNHIAELNLLETPEWKRWQQADGMKFEQEDFALFIEDNMPEIQRPAGAEMLEVSRSLQSAKSVKFRSSIRLEDGQTQLNYVEEIDSQAGEKGQLTIPDKIGLGITLYRGGDAYALEARFRYRISNGKVKMWYELIRAERIIEDAVTSVFKEIEAGLQDKSFAIYHGKSPIDSSHSHY